MRARVPCFTHAPAPTAHSLHFLSAASLLLNLTLPPPPFLLSFSLGVSAVLSVRLSLSPCLYILTLSHSHTLSAALLPSTDHTPGGCQFAPGVNYTMCALCCSLDLTACSFGHIFRFHAMFVEEETDSNPPPYIGIL
jgi:hypothetical protein